MQPKDSTQLDYEVELGIVIGKRARNVDEKSALKHVAGYCLMNDVSERDFQIRRGGGQWGKGKGCDTFGPIGPWLVTRDEIRDPQNLGMWLDVNGVRRQTGNTSTMIFGVAKLVSDVSQYMTLEPGDLITTGTPPGVAMGMKPPTWLQPGDVVELGIDGLGTQKQRVIAYRSRR
jgi:2-keto-4-pentenoate hydratase/2-oxohepta-3-ene-1,7-dioic acid hydratase in catechol pathway